jgi:Ethanolamine utilization protein EutJ (predicted chaperonin)
VPVSGTQLGIDFGTSNTVAVLTWPDGRSQALLFDGSPIMPSAVFLASDGSAVTGRAAQRSARSDPARYEPSPKRCIDDDSVLLGDVPIPVAELVAVVLRRVADEAVRVGGGPPARTVLTHPVGWGPRRREVLRAAAERAGLGSPGMLAEPLAATAYFTGVLNQPVAVGSVLVVYDFGGGTFDVSVVRREPGDGWLVLAGDGLTDVGGVDLDEVLVTMVAEQVPTAGPATTPGPGGWQRLRAPTSAAERRYRRMLLDDVREAKEQLSISATAAIHVPLLDVEAFVTREDFERRARPWLDRTVALTAATIAATAVPADRIAGVFLVGGASRIPLAATLLHRRLGVAPTVIEQPELVVAQGALRAASLIDSRPVEPVAPTGPEAPASPAVPATPAPPQTPPLDAPELIPPAPHSPDGPVPDPAPAPSAKRYRTGHGTVVVLALVAILIGGVVIVGLAKLGDPAGAPSGRDPLAKSSLCVQPDTSEKPVANTDMFCDAALRQFAQPWLGATHCSVPKERRGPESVVCEQDHWTVSFVVCESGKFGCLESRAAVRANGATVSSNGTYTSGRGIDGTKIVGSRAGVAFLYWDANLSTATATMWSKTVNGVPSATEAELQTAWQQLNG